MSRVLLLATLLLAACAAPAAVSAPSVATSATPIAASVPQTEVEPIVDTCPDGSMPIPTRFRSNVPWTGTDGCPVPRPTPTPPHAMPPEVPMPVVTVKAAVYTTSPAPPLSRVATSDFPEYATNGFGYDLMRFLDRSRGVSPHDGCCPGAQVNFDEHEWDGRIWPGAFQDLARRITKVRPPTGRFFHFESLRVDAVYSLPWAVALPNMPGTTASGFQFVEVTIRFRDHAETPPAEGELWYTWHLRLPTSGTSVYAIADGYDESLAKTWMNASANYWPRSLLEQEATSAVAGYLWTESFVPGGGSRGSGASGTPFWDVRAAGLNHLNELFTSGALTERRFENMTVRIERFEPMTHFGGGVVNVTIGGRLVEVLNGKTITETFTQPLKFFRFGGNGVTISGWVAVDAQEDGVWLSGGNLALDKLQTAHG